MKMPDAHVPSPADIVAAACQGRSVAHVLSKTAPAHRSRLAADVVLGALAAGHGALAAQFAPGIAPDDAQSRGQCVVAAAKAGNLRLLQALRLPQLPSAPFDQRARVAAASRGHLHVLQELPPPATTACRLELISAAAVHGHVAVVLHLDSQWRDSSDLPCVREAALVVAAATKHDRVVNALLGLTSANDRTLLIAAESGGVRVFKLIVGAAVSVAEAAGADVRRLLCDTAIAASRNGRLDNVAAIAALRTRPFKCAAFGELVCQVISFATFVRQSKAATFDSAITHAVLCGRVDIIELLHALELTTADDVLVCACRHNVHALVRWAVNNDATDFGGAAEAASHACHSFLSRVWKHMSVHLRGNATLQQVVGDTCVVCYDVCDASKLHLFGALDCGAHGDGANPHLLCRKCIRSLKPRYACPVCRSTRALRPTSDTPDAQFEVVLALPVHHAPVRDAGGSDAANDSGPDFID